MIDIPAAKIKESTNESLQIEIPKEYKELWLSLLAYCEQKRITQLHVKIGKPVKPRTTGFRSQNHHLNGHIQQICQETGDYFDDMKTCVKRRAVARGYPTRTDVFGDIVPLSESAASTVECALLIEEVHVVASFLSVELKEWDDE